MIKNNLKRKKKLKKLKRLLHSLLLFAWLTFVLVYLVIILNSVNRNNRLIETQKTCASKQIKQLIKEIRLETINGIMLDQYKHNMDF